MTALANSCPEQMVLVMDGIHSVEHRQLANATNALLLCARTFACQRIQTGLPQKAVACLA